MLGELQRTLFGCGYGVSTDRRNGVLVSLHGSKSSTLMSAKGQERTSKLGCSLHLLKRTFDGAYEMSGLCE